ncbi:PREDICTED: uncharacterized protein LOC109352557 isoform X2 [Lupinus angustifolius]|uniref:uncharacterized protein LOC109352557 isoform X2 n=1 Tax=Lupinus angustifolius TaxID=3871 RepID=UPI00092E98C4|nr:PREDICTED: uncharacterized protein LOC109352557 isoform X2 [Lupinus angustifolius]
MAGVKRRLCSDSDIHAFHKELDEVSCPICMDHPHNAVLLHCSSHEKGCRSYICDTSYRHSNCLDRFKKLRDNSKDSPNLVNTNNSGSTEGDAQVPSRHLDPHDEGILETADSETLQDRAVLEVLDANSSSESKLSLKCPLCRGTVQGWEVNEEARNHLNMKKRSCSVDSCSFVGNYLELRRHARRVHPTSRPSDVDPVRERDWQHFEHQREYADIVSAIQSAIPDAVVVGDYVLENGDELEGNMENVNAAWLTTTILFQMIDGNRTIEIVRGSRPRAHSTVWRRQQRRPAFDPRRRLAGNLFGIRDNNNAAAGEDDSPVPRRRRRLSRTRSNEDQS